MCSETHIVAEFRIGGHLRAALVYCPVLGFTDESTTDSLLPKFRLYVPALEIADMVCLAILDVWADTRLEKSH